LRPTYFTGATHARGATRIVFSNGLCFSKLTHLQKRGRSLRYCGMDLTVLFRGLGFPFLFAWL